MPFQRSLWGMLRLHVLTNVFLGIAACSTCWGITLGQVDDFNNTTSTLNWGIGTDGSFPVENAAGAGPTMMAGDNALFMDTFEIGVSRLLVINAQQWTGDWTAAGVEQVSMDVRNPNAFALSMRLGIAGPGLAGSMGSGDTYVTAAIPVPADDAWHSITFDVLAADFIGYSGTNIDVALAGVTHFRVLHNPAVDFKGAVVNGGFYLDNIRATAASGGIDGDYNADGIVDAADYVFWRDSVGRMGADLSADGNGDTTVNLDDYNYWKLRFGNSSGSGAATAIPEPATPLLAAMLLSIVGFWRRFALRGIVRLA